MQGSLYCFRTSNLPGFRLIIARQLSKTAYNQYAASRGLLVRKKLPKFGERIKVGNNLQPRFSGGPSGMFDFAEGVTEKQQRTDEP